MAGRRSGNRAPVRQTGSAADRAHDGPGLRAGLPGAGLNRAADGVGNSDHIFFVRVEPSDHKPAKSAQRRNLVCRSRLYGPRDRL